MKFLQSLLEQQYRSDYNPTDVLSKLTAGDSKEHNNKATDSTCFGLEDSTGNIVKVYVKKDQAKEFEQALSFEMDDDEDKSITDREIAEILYKLHDKFDIVDVKWPNIEEDEEGDENMAPAPDAMGDDMNSMPQDQSMPGADDPAAMGGDMGQDVAAPPVDDQSKTALDSVVQAMIADSEAKRQEAVAKAAEARAREAEAAAKIAEQKLKAEEEVADMEAYHGAINDEKKEAKKLAKLALYRHAMKQRDTEMGQFNTASDALSDQQASSEERIDQPNGVNPPGTEPSSPQTHAEKNPDIKSSLDGAGFENEEKRVDGPKTSNRRFKDLKSVVKYLHSMQVRRGSADD